jgi:hypothetical protein
MNARFASYRLLVPCVLASSLVVAGCSKKEEPPAPEPIPVAAATPPAPTGASGGTDWSWADHPATPAATTPPPVATPPESEPSHPITPAPPADRPKPREKPESTNHLSKPNHANEPAPAPEPEPEPVTVRYTANAGTGATLRLDHEVSSATAQVGDAVTGTLASDLTDSSGHVVLPAGTKLSGTVTEATSAKKVQKKSSVAFALTEAELPDGERVSISIGKHAEGKGWTKKQGAIIGGSAAGGAILGQILGHDTKSTAAGAVVGGAIASGVVMSKKGEDVTIPAGEEMTLPLDVGVTVEHVERGRRVGDSR